MESKKDKIKGITEHFRAAISFQLMICGIILGCLWIYWKINQPTPLIGLLFANALFTIMNTLRVLNGEVYLHPIFNKKHKPKTK